MSEALNDKSPASTTRRTMECPSCGETIEDVKICYYCCSATESKCRVTERKLLLWACATAVLGIGLLAWAATVETPTTPISELTSAGAFQHFRVQGDVTRTYLVKTPYADSDVFSFWVVDESVKGSKGLKVKVDGALYLDLKEAGKLPKQGDRVDVEGTLYAGEGFKLLSLNTVAMLRIAAGSGKGGD